MTDSFPLKHYATSVCEIRKRIKASRLIVEHGFDEASGRHLIVSRGEVARASPPVSQMKTRMPVTKTWPRQDGPATTGWV
jgi:hypothetical protein